MTDRYYQVKVQHRKKEDLIYRESYLQNASDTAAQRVTSQSKELVVWLERENLLEML